MGCLLYTSITVTGGVYAAKYNVYGVRFNDLGAKGRLSFRINDRMKTVSYTHLDVYKRQRYARTLF